MKTPLTPLQQLVAKHYCDGEFAHIDTQEDADNAGDTLFSFCVREAADMSGPYDLSDDAKNHVRWETLAPDTDWWDDVYTHAKKAGVERGFTIRDISFRGFCSQGDGASWKGNVNVAEFIRYHADKPVPSTVQEILILLVQQDCIPRFVPITNSGRGEHSGCMGVGDIWYNTCVNERVECDGPFDGAEPDVLLAAITIDGKDPLEALNEWISKKTREYADDIYRQLEAEYAHQTSDEYLKDLCECNEYVFDEKGNLV